jgi:hypothetical protein
MSKSDTRRAWYHCDNEHGFDDPCWSCKYLASGFADARLSILREVREWAGTNSFETEHCSAVVDLDDLLAKLDEMEKRDEG